MNINRIWEHPITVEFIEELTFMQLKSLCSKLEH